MKSMKKIAIAAVVLGLSASANAWWGGPFGNNGYNNNSWGNNGNGYGMGDGAMDGNFGFNMSGNARGRGNGYNSYKSNYIYYL